MRIGQNYFLTDRMIINIKEKIMKKRESMFVLRQPTHTIMSIIVINELPVSDNFHKFLGDLPSISDILFIFSSSIKGIDCKKFSSLYNASCYMVADNGLISGLLFSIRYVKEIFGKHISYSIVNSSCLSTSPVSTTYLENLEKVNASSLSSIICCVSRLSKEELSDIYTLPSRSWFTRPSDTNIFARYKLSSRFCYLKSNHITSLLRFNEQYISSFSPDALDLFLGSFIKESCLRLLNEDIEELNYGDL